MLNHIKTNDICVRSKIYIWNGSIIEKTCFILLAYEKKRNDMPCTNILFWVKSTSKLREGCYFIFITFCLDLQDGSHLVLHVIHVLFHLYKMLTWIENNLFCIAWLVTLTSIVFSIFLPHFRFSIEKNYLNYIIFGLWYVQCRQIILNPIKLSRCIRLQLKIWYR